MDNYPYISFPKEYNGNEYVIPDIHGCLLTFKALLKNIKLKKDDRLFLLGDYIDRGPDSLVPYF